VGLVLIVSVAGYFSFQRLRSSDYFSVKRIVAPKELATFIRPLVEGTSLFDVDSRRVHEAINRRHPEYKHIWVERLFPSTVRVVVEERVPFAQLKNNFFYLLDREFVITADRSTTPFKGMVTIVIDDFAQAARRGVRIEDERLIKAYELIDSLKGHEAMKDFRINHINANSLMTISFSLQGVRIIVGSGGYSRKIELLGDIIQKKLKGDLSSLIYIDLRSKRPYIGYKR